MPAPPSPAGTLSKLPIEITDYVLQMLKDRDLVCVGRVNSWYRNMVVPILTERITHQIEHDGWRIYVNAVSQFVVREEEEEEQEQEEEKQVQGNEEEQATASSVKSNSTSSTSAATTGTTEPLSAFWGDQEAKLLGELRSIDSETLALDFDAMPLDEEHGFRSLMTSNNNDDTSTNSNIKNEDDENDLIRRRSTILLPLNPRHMEIDIHLYFAKIGVDTQPQRLERANVMGIMTLGARELCHRALLEGDFENRVAFGNVEDVSVHYRVTRSTTFSGSSSSSSSNNNNNNNSSSSLAPTIRVEFDGIQTSPEWFLCQISNPYDFYMQYISEHSIW